MNVAIGVEFKPGVDEVSDQQSHRRPTDNVDDHWPGMANAVQRLSSFCFLLSSFFIEASPTSHTVRSIP